jgi:hypothetical protein
MMSVSVIDLVVSTLFFLIVSFSDTCDRQAHEINEKQKFENLFREREQEVDPYSVVHMPNAGCISRNLFTYTLSHRYITLSPFTTPIQPAKKGYVLGKLCNISLLSKIV